MISEPASTNMPASFWTISGLSITSSSGDCPGLSPIFWRLAPVDPSATSTSPELSRSRNLFIDSPEFGASLLAYLQEQLADNGSKLPDSILFFHKFLCQRICLVIWDQMGDVFERLVHVREVHCQHELVLELGIGGQLDPLHAARDRIDLVAFLHVQQRDARPVARGIAHRIDPAQLAIGDQPDQHGFLFVDVTSKTASQDNFIR